MTATKLLLAAVLACLIAAAPAAAAPGPYAKGPLDTAAVERLEADLARVGVAVTDPVTGMTRIAPSKPVSPVRLTTDQLAGAAQDVWNGAGISGSTLNKMMPALRLGRGKRIPVSALVVGWAVRSNTASARLARRMLPTRNLRRHARMVIPHVVLSLFAADVVRQLPGARVPPTASIAQSFGQAPCSATKNFIEDTINRVFAAIGQVHVNGPAIERKVGGFLGKILRFGAEAAGFVVNTVINAAHQILLNGIKVAIGLVTNAVAGVAAVIHTLGSIGNAILPWSPKLVADPPALAKSVDKRNPGTFDLKVTALGSDLEWPDWIKDCARTFGIELPTLKPKDADVKWDLGNQSPALLVVRTGDSGPLSDEGTARLSFETTPETAEVAQGEVHTGTATANVTVHRRDLDALRDKLLEDLFGALPTIIKKTVGKALEAVLRPIIDQATSRVTKLMDVETSATVQVAYHDPPDPKRKKRPSPAAAPSHRPDPCKLVTSSEAGQAVGTDVRPGLLRHGDQSGPVDWVNCAFISVEGQEHPNEDLPRAVFEVSLASVDTEDTARKYFDAGRAELGKKAKIAPVRDLGDAAFTAEACSGKVCVQTLWFRTGNLILFVVAENVYESRPAPVALARRALGRI